jgi:hypothetical protein
VKHGGGRATPVCAHGPAGTVPVRFVRSKVWFLRGPGLVAKGTADLVPSHRVSEGHGGEPTRVHGGGPPNATLGCQSAKAAAATRATLLSSPSTVVSASRRCSSLSRSQGCSSHSDAKTQPIQPHRRASSWRGGFRAQTGCASKRELGQTSRRGGFWAAASPRHGCTRGCLQGDRGPSSWV